jgi:hypothetical protein
MTSGGGGVIEAVGEVVKYYSSLSVSQRQSININSHNKLSLLRGCVHFDVRWYKLASERECNLGNGVSK